MKAWGADAAIRRHDSDLLQATPGQAMSAGNDISASQATELRITQADLGRILGASRSKVNAELRRLERDGLLRLGYRSVTLADRARLRKLAGPDVLAF